MATISMNIPQLKADSDKWLELEQECIEIVNSINNQLESISNDALKTPMLKDNFDKLCSIYTSIENTLTTNINTINNFFINQFEKYDSLGTEASNATSTVSDSIGNIDNTNVNPASVNSNIANTVTEDLGNNFNSGSVKANIQGVETQTIVDNSLENPLENTGKENIAAVNKDATLSSNLNGPGIDDRTGNTDNIIKPKIEQLDGSNYRAQEPIRIDDREKNGFNIVDM